MKKLTAVAMLLMFAGASVKASNYPPDYTYQNIRVVSKGPALVAMVSSGIMRKLAIGYKSKGILGANGSINAVIKLCVSHMGYTRNIERVITIQKEWNGTGFMTSSIDPYDFAGSSEIQRIELAFFSGPRWDSNYSANYVFEKWDFDNSAAKYRSEHCGASDIDMYSWSFIVDQMRR